MPKTRASWPAALNNPSVYDRAAGGLAVSQLITDFGRTANLTASSKFQAQAENQNASATREQVLLQVDTSYFGALEAQAVLHVAQQTFDTRQLLLDQVTALATNKLRSELDVSFARVAVQEARLLLEKAQNDADAAMASLSTALGYREPRQFQLVEHAGGAERRHERCRATGGNGAGEPAGTVEPAQRTGRRAAVCQGRNAIRGCQRCPPSAWPATRRRTTAICRTITPPAAFN